MFFITSFFNVSSERIASIRKAISVNASFWETTSLEKTDKFVATISKSSFTSLVFKVSALFFNKLVNKDSIAPNFDINKLWRSSKFCFNSERNIFIKSISSSVLSFSNLELIPESNLSTSDVFSIPCALIEFKRVFIVSKFSLISVKLLISAINLFYPTFYIHY